jgi:ribosomal protein L11 methylase PrmA
MPLWNSVKDDGTKVYILSPGMAFAQASTKLQNVQELKQDYKIRANVIDIGCGSAFWSYAPRLRAERLI